VKLSDTVWGSLLLALALAVLWNVQSFPRIPGQNIGPAAFPGLLAVLLGGCAIALIVRGIRHSARHGAQHVTLGQWLSSLHHVGNFLLTITVLVFYIVAADTLGFIICALLILSTLFLKLGVKVPLAIPIAIVTAFVIHLIFYKMLRVTLPWGVLPVLY
jgi:putative tricarboxylic transport membrane protein